MLRLLIKSLFLTFLISNSFAALAQYDIVPRPVQVKSVKGRDFPLSRSTKVVNNFTPSGNVDFSRHYLDSLIEDAFPAVTRSKDYHSAITINRCDTIAPEGYVLEVKGNSMKLSASSSVGIFYGIQSLRQVFFNNRSKASAGVIWLNPVRIWDAPSFSYRGLLIDVVRHFYTIDEL